jgi:hypothetical protein
LPHIFNFGKPDKNRFTQTRRFRVDLEVLKKRISSYRTPKGRITRLPDDLLCEILIAWEQWSGPGREFYKAIGADHRKMASLMGRAKKLKRDGHFPEELFKEVKVQESPSNLSSLTSGPWQGVEILWENGKIIRFPHVDNLIDFLKKVA